MAAQNFLSNFLESFQENALWYLLFVSPAFYLFWIWGKERFRNLRIQLTQKAGNKQFLHDVGYSFSTIAIFAVLDVILLYFYDQGHTLIYTDLDRYGWTWLSLSFLVALFLDDTFFYWSHRAMHQPGLYRIFHRVHHESTDPSPLTAFAFHPTEALVEQMIHLILPFVLPLHVGVLLAWQIFSMLNNILAHLGYEVYPRTWMELPLLRFKTVSLHHNMHHERFHGNYALYFTWWDKWMGTEFPAFEQQFQSIFQRAEKKPESGFYKLQVVSIREEVNQAFSLELGHLPPVFSSFKAGQHLTLRIISHGKEYFRTFSISSIPGLGNTIRLTIKRIPGGKVTPFLAQWLSPGDFIEASAPSGNFFHQPQAESPKSYTMVAGGSGITPLFSMIGSILRSEPQAQVMLLYANRTRPDILFQDDLESMAESYQGRFRLVHFLSEDQSAGVNEISGQLQAQHLKEAMKFQGNSSPPAWYICGPASMADAVEKELRLLGVEQGLIFRERFATSANPASLVGSKNCRISATIEGKNYAFQASGSETILESALNQSVPLRYSCRQGQCGMCRMRCLEG